MAAESVGATPVSAYFAEFRSGSWVGGSRRLRRRSTSRRSPAGVMVNPRQPVEARSSTAHTSDRHEGSPGSRPMTLTRRRVSRRDTLQFAYRLPVYEHLYIHARDCWQGPPDW